MSAVSSAIVLTAILLPAGLYIWLALRQRKDVKSIQDFFPLTRFLDGESYGRSTAAAGVSLATVILALVNLAPLLGISLLVTVSSYALSFVVLYFCAPAILRANPANKTIQAYLGEAYQSSAVRSVALIFSFLAYVSIFSMELLVGVTVLQPFLGERVLLFSAAYLLFIIAYSIIGGYRAIVATEQWQIRFIVASVLVLVAFLASLSADARNVSLASISLRVFSSWVAPWSFCVGIIVMNVPAAVSDAGTWQRLCSTSSEHEAKKGLLRAIPMFILIWGTLIVFGCYIAQVAIATGRFDPQGSTLMTFILSSLAGNGFLHLVLLFIFILGLFAAMITTADSLLLVAAQMISIDFLHLDQKEVSNASNVKRARWVLGSIAVLSFGVFAAFHFIQFDVVQLIFAIYGAQLALFPPVCAALFLHRRLALQRLGIAASLAIFVGYGGAWAAAIYGKVSGVSAWLYNAPVVALVASATIFFLLSLSGWKKHAPIVSGNLPRM